MTNEAYFDNEEFREMLADYEQTVSSGGLVFMDVDDLADIADYYQIQERFDDAQKAIDRAIELQPDSVIALNFKVHEALSRDDFEEAESCLRQMNDDQAVEYIYCRAEIWMARDMADKADEYLKQFLKDIDKDEYQDYVLDVANLYNEYGYCEKALEWLSQAHPDDSTDFKEIISRAYMGIGAYDDAERILNELLDKHPFEKRYWRSLASVQYMKEDFSASITSSEYGIAIDPNDTECLMAKANALFQIANFAEALKYYERVTGTDADNTIAWLYQGNCLINMKRFDEAIQRLELCEQSINNNSSFRLELYQNLAFAYSETGHLKKALSYIDKTESLDCDHNEMKVIRGHILLSNHAIKQAVHTFRLAIEASGCSPSIMMRVIVSIYDNQYLTTAYRLFRRFFLFVDDDWNQGYAYMALCCYDLKKTDDYLHYLEEAIKRNPAEAKVVLGNLFPEGMSPTNYYEYATKVQTK